MTGLRRLGMWITENPMIITAVAVLLTVASVHYAQQIESQGMNTESLVETDSLLYQIYSHFYQENFGVDPVMVLMEADDVADKKALEAGLRLSDHMLQVHNIVGVQSLADIVADAEYQSSGMRRIPSQKKINEILSQASSDQLKTVMADRGHARMIAGMPTTLTDAQRNELLEETAIAIKLSDFPPDYRIIITGDPAFQAAIIEEMNKSNSIIFALAAILMVFALLLVFRHVRWALLPLPIVLLGILWTFGAMGLFHIPMTMVSFAAFPVLIGIGIDYAIQFHNRMNEERDTGMEPREAAVNTVSNVAVPVIIALMVTEAGFLSAQLTRAHDPGFRQNLHHRPGHVLHFGALCEYDDSSLIGGEVAEKSEWRRGRGKGVKYRKTFGEGYRLLSGEVEGCACNRPALWPPGKFCRYEG